MNLSCICNWHKTKMFLHNHWTYLLLRNETIVNLLQLYTNTIVSYSFEISCRPLHPVLQKIIQFTDMTKFILIHYQTRSIVMWLQVVAVCQWFTSEHHNVYYYQVKLSVLHISIVYFTHYLSYSVCMFIYHDFTYIYINPHVFLLHTVSPAGKLFCFCFFLQKCNLWFHFNMHNFTQGFCHWAVWCWKLAASIIPWPLQNHFYLSGWLKITPDPFSL